MNARDSVGPGGSASDNATSLISAQPILALLNEVRSQAATVKRWSPSGDVGDTMQRFVGLLEKALGEAREHAVFLKVEQVAALTGRPPSTITRLCRVHGLTAGAQKLEGQWSIHLPTFQSFLNQQQTRQRQEAA